MFVNWWILKRRLHPSWLIALACGGIIVGVATAQYISQIWFGTVSWLLVGLALIGLALWRRSIYLIPLALIGGTILGLWRGSIDQAQLKAYDDLYGREVTIIGSLYEDADTGSGGNLVLRLKDLKVDNHEIIGKVWVSTDTEIDIKRGDIITLNGKLDSGFGSFAATMYRAKIVQVQRPVPGDIARQVRDWFAAAVRRVIPEPEASLGIGYLVGQRRALPADLNEALRTVGLTHIVVASGYNLTILVRLARRLFTKISKYLAALASSGMIISFMAITGLSPSMSRAGLVAGLSLAAWYYGRKFHPLVLLLFSAAVTVLINPSYVWGDLGWQLSFAAFGGVMIVAPLLQRYFFGNKPPGNIRQILGETISAQLCTAPIIIASFGQLSNIALIANLLVLPLVPIAMLLTFIAGIGQLLVPAVAAILAKPAEWLLKYMVTVTQELADLPWAVSEVSFNRIGALICYAVIVIICLYMWRVTKYNMRDSNIVE